MPQYQVRRVHLGKTPQLDVLAHAAGEVYTRTLLFFWRTVRKQGLWLKPKHLMRLIPSDPEHLLHAHSVDRRCGVSRKSHDYRHCRGLWLQWSQLLYGGLSQDHGHLPSAYRKST